MGASLFLVVGRFNLAELFNEQRWLRRRVPSPTKNRPNALEARLKRSPEDPDLLATLTRARINAGNAQVIR